MSRTYAIVEVDEPAYAQIRGKLEKAGYEHAFHESTDGEVIDMHGLAIRGSADLTGFCVWCGTPGLLGRAMVRDHMLGCDRGPYQVGLAALLEIDALAKGLGEEDPSAAILAIRERTKAALTAPEPARPLPELDATRAVLSAVEAEEAVKAWREVHPMNVAAIAGALRENALLQPQAEAAAAALEALAGEQLVAFFDGGAR